MSSVIVVTYNGNQNITNNVLWAGTSFQASAGAIPGSARVALRDLDQTLSFVTGREISLQVDGVLVWGGFVRNITRLYAFEADYIEDANTYDARYFELDCADYNVLLDKRVIRNTANYTKFDLPSFPAGSYDGDLLVNLFDNYIDVPAGYDFTSEIDNVGIVNPTKEGMYESQGTYLRDQLKTFARWTAPVYYVSADKKFHWHALETVVKRWGFSDRPNNGTITTDPGYQGMTRGFRDCTATEDGSAITNDAMIWGGSVAGSDSNVIFARVQDATEDLTETATKYVEDGAVVPGSSIDLHGRWQAGQIHVNEKGSKYGNLDGVEAAAKVIVRGRPGAVGDDALRGLRYSQWAFRLSWFDHDVPLLSGVPNHIQVGDLVTIDMEAFGISRLLPCRQLSISAENVDENGNGIMRFTGDFALSIEDPWQLWNFLLNKPSSTSAASVVSVDNDSESVPYGALYQDVPSPAPDGIETYFAIPWGYISLTLSVYLNGLLQRPGVDYFEIDALTGEFQMSSPPYADDNLYVICRTIAS